MMAHGPGRIYRVIDNAVYDSTTGICTEKALCTKTNEFCTESPATKYCCLLTRERGTT